MSNEVATLWSISDDIQALRDSIEGMDPSDPLYAQAQSEYRDKMFAWIRKVTGVHARRAHLLAMVQRAEIMQSAFLAARLAAEREIEDLDEYAKAVMEHYGVKELEGGDGLKIKLKANPPSVVIVDEALIPWEFREVVTPPPVEKIVKAKIAKALKAGIDVPGADLNISSCRVDWGDPPKSKAKAVEPPPQGELE